MFIGDVNNSKKVKRESWRQWWLCTSTDKQYIPQIKDVVSKALKDLDFGAQNTKFFGCTTEDETSIYVEDSEKTEQSWEKCVKGEWKFEGP